MGVYSGTQANAYADKIKAVYEHLAEIRKVADRLTVVEDVSIFNAQVSALYAQLDLLVEASTLIVTATPTGEAILTGTVPSIKALLGIPYDYITQAELDAALNGLNGINGIDGRVDGVLIDITNINILITELNQFFQIQQATLSGLEINYTNIAAGLETSQSNLALVLQRLTVQEQFATLFDAQLDTIDQNLTSTILGLQAANSIISGHTASITTAFNYISLQQTSIDSLQSTLTSVQANVTANTSAISLMQTSIIGIGNDIIAGSQQTIALRSVIGGSGNLLPNADFAASANGWAITVAEEDWAGSVLELNAFNTPADVNTLSVLGTPTPLGQIVIESPSVLVTAGNHYYVSGYPCVDNGIIQFSYKLFNNAGAVVGQDVCPATFNVTTNPNFSNYTRTSIKFLAPAGATKMRLYLTVTGDGDFITQAGLFRPMIERAWIDQVGPSEWTPNVSGVPEALAEAIQQLTTEVGLIDGEYTSLSSSVTSLTSRVGTAEAALVNEMITRANQYGATSSSLNTLTSRMTAAEGTITAQGTAISGLQTSVSAINGTVTSHSSSLISLQAQVNALDAGTGGSAGAISALNTRVTAAEGNITSMSSSITALQASVTSANRIYAQNESPSTVDGRPGDMWIDTNDGNKIYTLAGGVWVPRPDNLRNRVFAQNDQPTATNVGDIWIELDNGNKVWLWNGLTWVDATDARTIANGTAITTLQTRATAIEGVNTSQGSAITALESSVNNPATGLSVTASALSALTVRVTAAEGVNTSQASSITALNSTIAGKADVSAVTELTTRVTEMQGAGQNLLVNATFQASLSGWSAEGSVAGFMVRDAHATTWRPFGMHSLVLQPASTGTVDVDYYYCRQDVLVEAGKQYIASAYMSAHRCKGFVYLIWIDQDGAFISSTATANTVLAGGGTDLAANFTRLAHKVTAPANAKKVAVCFGYRKSLTGIPGENPYIWVIRPMFEEVGAAQVAPSRWNSGGIEMFASYSLTLDVNGYVSGYQSNNDGTMANFAILANNFSVNVPGGGPGLAWNNGILWNRGSGYSVLIGQDMSPTSDVIFWIGPTPASAAAATKAAATMWIDELGNASFSGMLYGSIISSSALELGSTRIHTGGGRLAPFTAKGAAYKGTGAKFAGTCELAPFVSPDVGTGYDSKRCARLVTDVNIRADMRGNGESGNKDVLYLEVQYDGGAWTTIISKADISVDNNGGWLMLIRYTSIASWSSMKFRARTTGGRTVVLAIEAEVDNTYETTNAAGSFSGTDASSGTGGVVTGTTSGGTPGTGGTGGTGGGGTGGSFCVVADLTFLPDGTMVQDRVLQSDFPCWNGDSENPDIEMHPLRSMPEGYEECFILMTENDCMVPQSISTPIPIRGGQLVKTLETLHKEVLTNIDGVLAWSRVNNIASLGIQRVVKPDLGDRVFFAGMDPRMTIATHNVVNKGGL